MQEELVTKSLMSTPEGDKQRVCVSQGKYQDKSRLDPESRLVKYRGRYAEAESRYGPKPNVHAAVEAYVQLAQQAGLPPYEMALRYEALPTLCCL